MTDVQSIYNILLGRKYQERLFSNLGKTKREGREMITTCPFCEGHRFSYSMDKPLWQCWSCGKKGDWLRYIMIQEGLTFWDALLQLAKEAGVEVNQADEDRYLKYTKKADILERAQEIFRETLFQPEGETVLQYLLNRGYKESDIKAMGLGAYVDQEKLKIQLVKEGYSTQEIKDSGLLTTGLGGEYPMVVLFKDRGGRAIGMAGRSLLDKEELDAKGLKKYKYALGSSIGQGLPGYESARGSYKVIIVEGLLDAVLLSSQGEPVVAMGGTSLSAEKLRALEEAGTEEIILALDKDEVGQTATERISRELMREVKLRPYVLTMPEGYKDPDELVRDKGIEAFRELVDKAERASGWLARRIVSKHDINTARGMDQALSEALSYSAEIKDFINKKSFMQELTGATGLSLEDMSVRQSMYEEETSRIEKEKILQDALKKVEIKNREHDFHGAEKLLNQALSVIKENKKETSWDQYQNSSMGEWKDNLLNMPDGYKTGFGALDKYTSIPSGAMTIIAGRPGHGKTTFLLNLLCNMMREYEDKEFYFFTYEMSATIIQLNLLMIMAGKVLGDGSFSQREYKKYLREKEGTDRDIDKAIKELDGWMTSGRLKIIDSMVYAEELTRRMDGLKGRPVGGIFIDYIQKIYSEEQRTEPRYVTIQRVSSIISKKAVEIEAPIILGAQFNRDGIGRAGIKLSNIRECGDIEQDAHLVLGIYNPTVDEMDDKGAGADFTDYRDLENKTMEVYALKQRNGEPQRMAELHFNMPIYKLKDTKKWEEEQKGKQKQEAKKQGSLY